MLPFRIRSTLNSITRALEERYEHEGDAYYRSCSISKDAIIVFLVSEEAKLLNLLSKRRDAYEDEIRKTLENIIIYAVLELSRRNGEGQE